MNNTQTAVITGSTGGIGQEISRTLAERGWNLILLNRSPQKTKQQISELKASYPQQEYYAYFADLTDINSVKSASSAISEQHKRINALFNVAGLMTNKRLLGPQGIESQFAVNTVAPYVLLHGLRKSLSAGVSEDRKSIVVNFTSSMINSVKTLDVDKLPSPEKIAGMGKTYSATKLAINVVNQSLKQALSEEGILVLAVDPGPTKTPMTTNMEGIPWIFKLLASLMTKDVKKQTRKVIRSVFEARYRENTGVFISEGNVKKEHKVALDLTKQSQVSNLLERIRGFSKHNAHFVYDN